MAEHRRPSAGSHKLRIRYAKEPFDIPDQVPEGGVWCGGTSFIPTLVDTAGSWVVGMGLRMEEDQYDQETHTRAKAAIRRAREAKEEAATRKIERATEVAKEAAARKEKETAEKEKERRARLKEMLEETEGVALNIAKAERAIWEEEGKCRKEGENEDGGGVDYENEVEALDWIYP